MQSHKPIVSVIVAAYNQENFIGRCLRSLLAQSLPKLDYEVIVVDDGSNDLTSYALRQFMGGIENNITVLQNSKNLGLPHSINRGVSTAQGDFIVRVDSDDYVSKHFLLLLTEYMLGNPSAAAVACDYWTVTDSDEFIERKDSMEEQIACGIIFKKSELEMIGGYDEKFLVNEEKELRARFERYHVIEHLPIPLYRYRRHENNMTNNLELMSKYDELLTNLHD